MFVLFVLLAFGQPYDCYNSSEVILNHMGTTNTQLQQNIKHNEYDLCLQPLR